MVKKAQGLSMNFIILAIIALAVLVVILFIFGGKAKFFATATKDLCDASACQRAYKGECTDDEVVRYATLEKGQVCAYASGKTFSDGETVKCCKGLNE